MIEIKEVLEEAAREVLDARTASDHDGMRETLRRAAERVRALAAKYEGDIVAEGKPYMFSVWQAFPLYRAKEKGPLQAFLDAGRKAGITHLGDLTDQEPTK
jgi:hypothetical protein